MVAGEPQLVIDASERLIATLEAIDEAAPDAFAAARQFACHLGARWREGRCEVGFWAPELREARIPDGDIFLEVLVPEGAVDLAVSRQTLPFRRHLVPLLRYETLVVGVVEGLEPGRRDRIGPFYALAWRDGDGGWHRILDPLAASVPYGVFAPAELYDLDAMQARREDRAYWQALAGDGVFKMPAPTNILQIHVPTATAGGTLASLTRRLRHIAHSLERGVALSPADSLFSGYDAVQLMPVEPTTVHERGPAFWLEEPLADGNVTVTLRRPDTTNWGYDVVIAGSAAVNPTLLESGRPDELAELAAVLHNFPGGPIRLILDVVFGHSDNQGLSILNAHYFSGANMYGQDLAYRNLMVRAILLEMQRRKVDFGADGVRVDGAQDFKWYDAEHGVLRHDDAYLREMAAIEQDVAGCCFRPWFVFEDGRPWPQEDWELASTYRAVIEDQADPDVCQWGPLTFAHNTPFLYGFWLSKWWRIREITRVGANWISGCANHDTLRRGTQVNPKLNINTRLGSTRMEILQKAYDNPAVQMVTYAAFPGVPMDFLNASARAAWGFIRNQDDRYGVKVVAEEAISLKWQIDDKNYRRAANFRRLKALGFHEREQLRRFLEFLPGLVEVTDYDLDAIAKLLAAVEPPLAVEEPITVGLLKRVARAWMDDMHDYCNVTLYDENVGARQTAFNAALRAFRRERPWLRANLDERDVFDYAEPVAGSVLFRCLRHDPEGEQVLMVANMEGAPVGPFDPVTVDLPGLDPRHWRLALATPPIGADYQRGPVVLHDSTGLVFTRRR